MGQQKCGEKKNISSKGFGASHVGLCFYAGEHSCNTSSSHSSDTGSGQNGLEEDAEQNCQ